jgi:hypothetical protein
MGRLSLEACHNEAKPFKGTAAPPKVAPNPGFHASEMQQTNPSGLVLLMYLMTARFWTSYPSHKSHWLLINQEQEPQSGASGTYGKGNLSKILLSSDHEWSIAYGIGTTQQCFGGLCA